jgi:hypothetical protein
VLGEHVTGYSKTTGMLDENSFWVKVFIKFQHSRIKHSNHCAMCRWQILWGIIRGFAGCCYAFLAAAAGAFRRHVGDESSNARDRGYVPVILASRYSENYKLNFIYLFWVDILIYPCWILNCDSGSLKCLESHFSDSLFSHNSAPLNHILNHITELCLNHLLWTPLIWPL